MNTALIEPTNSECVESALPEHRLKFLAPRSLEASRELPGSARDGIRAMLSALDSILRQAVAPKTAAEFERVQQGLFLRYVPLVIALSAFIRAIVPDEVVEAITEQSLVEVDLDFDKAGVAAFGKPVRDQAVFTLWTFRKTIDLVERFATLPVPEDKRTENKRIFSQYLAHRMRSQFSLDCLTAALRNEVPVFPEVLDRLVEGLRAAVNAYTLAREAYDIRAEQGAPEQARVWDDEDAQLAALAAPEITAEE
ncbi:MAG: hypothetical protein ACRD2H_06435 [Terriglobales bacterium]